MTCVKVHSSYLHKGCRKPNYCSLITIHDPNGFSWHFYTTIMFVYLRSDSDPMTQFTKRDLLFSSQNRKMRSSDGAYLWFWCPPKMQMHMYIYNIYIYIYYIYYICYIYIYLFTYTHDIFCDPNIQNMCTCMQCNVMYVM